MSRLCARVLLFVGLSASAAAQVDIATLKQRGELANNEQTALRTWISVQLDQLQGDDPQPAFDALRDALRDSTPAFRATFGALMNEAAAPRLASMPPSAATRVLAVMYEVRDAAAVGLFVQALRSQQPLLRAAGAAGLRRLTPQLAREGPGEVRPVLTTLVEAGRAETSPAVLTEIYDAMDYTSVANADLGPMIEATLQLLQTRVSSFEDGRAAAATGVDMRGVRLLLQPRVTLSAEQRQQLARLTAQCMRQCVWRYTSDAALRSADTPDVRQLMRRLEACLVLGEQSLTQLGIQPQPQPDLANAMRDSAALVRAWNTIAAAFQGEFASTLELPLDLAVGGGDGGPR